MGEPLKRWKALDNIEFQPWADPTFTRDKTGVGDIEVMFKDTPEEGYLYGTNYNYPHPLPGQNVVIFNPATNDEQDIRLDALHIMPQDPTYDVLRSRLAYYGDNSDLAINAERRMQDDMQKYGHLINSPNQYYQNEVDGFLRNMLIEGSPEYIESKRYFPDKQKLREWNAPLMPYVDAIQQYLETGEKPPYVLDEVVVSGNKHEEGGQMEPLKMWDELSISEKGAMMREAMNNGIMGLQDIRDAYNEYARGGNLYVRGGSKKGNSYSNIPGFNPNYQSTYDMIPQVLAMDGVKAWVSSGARPGAIVHKNGKSTGRRSQHGVGEAWDIVGDIDGIKRAISDPNSYTSRWMRSTGLGVLDETRKYGTTAHWAKQDGNDHSHYHFYVREKGRNSSGQSYDNAPSGNYLDLAKQMIRQNEGFRTKSYADGPAGTGWRSVGYGFNDSGFRSKYPGGISKYYDSKGGITKEEAEKELDYALGRFVGTLKKTYGSRWDAFSDSQKAAIIDTMYQRPASVMKGSSFYNAIMSNNPNAVNYLGVNGYEGRNGARRKLFGNDLSGIAGFEGLSQQETFNPQDYYQPLSAQGMDTPLSSYAALYQRPEKENNPLIELAMKAYSPEAIAKQEKEEGLRRFNMMQQLLSAPTDSDDSFVNTLSMMTDSQIPGIIGMVENAYKNNES